MKVKQLIELLQVVQEGLEGHPFEWGDGQRKSWTPKLEKCGITLVTKTQIAKRGYRVKKGKKPVGSAYFGTPIKRYAELYVLEEQCAKIEIKECWQFLDCKELTGYEPQNCPNHNACKNNAKHSRNRACHLPYKIYSDHLEVYPPSKEAFLAGWAEPVRLFYEYSLENKHLYLTKTPPPEAKSLGWDWGEDIFLISYKDGIYVGKKHINPLLSLL